MFLALQHTYTTIEVGLFDDNATSVDTIVIDKTVASRELIPTLNTILERNNYALSDVHFIAVNKGPGPFTTLRVVIATVNGIAMATNIPLVAVDGLDTMLQEHQTSAWPITIVALNAFNNDLYYAIQSPTVKEFGVKKAQELAEQLATLFGNAPIRCIGNGVSMLQEAAGTRNIHIPADNPQHPSLVAIAQQGLVQWQQKDVVHYVEPAYLKTAF